MAGAYFSIAFLITIGLVLSSYILLFLPFSSKIRRRNKKFRKDGIEILADPGPDLAKFEIVAVHGLGADPDFTWGDPPKDEEMPKDEKRHTHNAKTIHLLRVLFKDDFKDARILSFAHNSDWLIDAPIKSAQQIGKTLLDQLIEKRQQPRLPIILIGHSFGGIIIKEALCATECSTDILSNTSGIIFLGTPHQGSSVSYLAARLASWTSFLGSDNTLLLSLRNDGQYLRSLEERFRVRVGNRLTSDKIISFCETKPTLIFGWLSIGLIVNKNSAFGNAMELVDLDTDHTGLNKFSGKDDPRYKKLSEYVKALRAPTKFDSVYDYIRENSYTKDKLMIERLDSSAAPLPIDQSYINLAIVTQFGEDMAGNITSQSSPFSLFDRLKIETPTRRNQVDLSTLFNQRELPGGEKQNPRRILIRGRAGVGKTTLCKKIVHDIIYKRMWSEVGFQYVFWVPLRRLKYSMPDYTLSGMFRHVYKIDETSAKVLWRAMAAANYRSSLFILDGLDEVSELTDENSPASHILEELLGKPNIIVTARPGAVLSKCSPEFELETIGFYPDQVQRYLEKIVTDSEKHRQIQSYLQQHQLVQSLVRIPIQLEALCLAWEELHKESFPNTMSTIYKAIVKRLWRKDTQRLERKGQPYIHQALDLEIDKAIAYDNDIVECLAFSGMLNNVVEFQPKHRHYVLEMVGFSETNNLSLYDLLARLSFLRTSDPSIDVSGQSHHFLHLTFQEYFAAQYFVRQWRLKQDLKYSNFEDKTAQIHTVSHTNFLKQNKYNSRYEIVWRFAIGLLQQNEVKRFFDAIEQEPRDLLGPMHQRLVFHCLSEADASRIEEYRSILEGKLSEWLVFQPLLAKENEFPDQPLRVALRSSSISTKKKYLIIQSLDSYDRFLSNEIITDLEALLEDEDSDIRSAATKALSIRPNLSEKTVSRLKRLLPGGESEIYNAASEAIRNQSSLSQKTITALMESMQGDNRSIRLDVARALGNESNLPQEVVSSLVEMLKNARSPLDRRNRDERHFRAEAPVLEAIADVTDVLNKQITLSEENITTLLELSKSSDHLARYGALGVLASQPRLSERIVTALVRLLEETNDSTKRRITVRALSEKELPEEYVSILLQLLENASWDVRHGAAEVLASQSEFSNETQIALARLARGPNVGVRYAAATALKEQSNVPEVTVKYILELLEDEHVNEALTKGPELSDRIIMILISILKNGNPRKRGIAVKVLETQSNMPERIINDLTALLGNKNWCIREQASLILGNQSRLPKEAIMALVDRLSIEGPRAPKTFANTLKKEPNLPESAITTLTQLLKHTDEYVRFDTTIALGGQSGLPRETVTALVALLESRNWGLRIKAADILVNQSTISEEAATSIVSLFEENGGRRNHRVINVLLNRSDWPESTTQKLIQLFGGPDFPYRRYVVHVLGKQSKLSKKVAMSLVTLLKEADEGARETITRNLVTCPSLLDKIFEALGISWDSEDSAKSTEPFSHETIEALFGSFLYRSFEEQLALLIGDDGSSLYLIRANGSRMVIPCHPLSKDDVLKWRRAWGCPELGGGFGDEA
ncbi:hypothetical protein M426DRAFT_195206 [Hypoxylon sp. CI-4A]|nr:hypothetical protein M426DRAFT_195206 [Hypoxylon sp. CI-4A]